MAPQSMIIFWLTIGCMTATASSKKKNVLFLVADDMRPELGCYSGPDFPGVHQQMHTPHLDELASHSLLLGRAFVQQALCSPSRTATLTGRRPDTTKVYDLTHYFRHIAGNFTTIPQYFKEHGYTTAGMGKIFHPGQASGFDDPISWTEPYFHAKGHWPQYYGYGKASSWHVIDKELLEDKPLVDQQIAQHAVDTLKKVAKAAKTGEKPFFVAAGFHRPHLPWVIPSGFLELYPLETIKLPDNPYLPEDYPEIAWSTFKDLRSYEDIRKITVGNMYNTSFAPDVVKSLRRAYFAAVSYTDSLIGKVIQTLKDLDLENDTVISFFGDHGYQLGEHAEWAKHNNFDLSVHAPMMLSIPGLTDEGVVTRQLTEFVDLFPSLAEAAGLPSIPLCPEDSSYVKVCTEGVSVLPLIENPTRAWKKAAFSQYPRLDIAGMVDMGYTMRTDQYRYTEWVNFDYPNFKPLYGEYYPFITYAELYDHSIDPGETVNYVNDPKYKGVRKNLAAMLREGWRHALPRENNMDDVSNIHLEMNPDIL